MAEKVFRRTRFGGKILFDELLLFIGVYPGDAGHNYDIIEGKEMKKIVFEKDNQVVIKNNPAYLSMEVI